MTHQTGGVNYAFRSIHPAFLMEMRTGKTLTTIRWVKGLRRSRFILVLAPVTVLEAWEKELFLEGERYSTCYGVTAKQRKEACLKAWVKGETRRHWLLMNYEGFVSMGDVATVKRKGKLRRVRSVPEIGYLEWDAVILDESTKIKNPTAQVTKVCLKGFRKARRRAILTGLPNPESDLDLICQFLFLDGQFMGFRNYWDARNTLFVKGAYNWVPKNGTRARIKRYVHERSHVVTAAEAGMPNDVVRQVRYVDMTPVQKRMYKEIAKTYATTTESGTKFETKWVLARNSWLQQLSGGFDPEKKLISPKIADDIVSLLQGELQGQKAVIWFKFRHELEYMEERLKRAGISCVGVMGGESRDVRKRKIAAFRGTTRLLLATEKVAKFGIDCSAASVSIYYSNEWGNEDRRQSEERTKHPFKDQTRLIIDYAIRGFVSEELLGAIREKSLNSRIFMMKLEGIISKWAGSL